MNEAPIPTVPPEMEASATADNSMAWLGVILGFAPVLAGLLFRTYTYDVAPAAAELLRQLDVPFVLIEIFVIVWARAQGLRFDAIIAGLDRPAKWALAIFASSFWVSSVFLSEQPGYSVVRASFWLIHIAFGFAVFHLGRTTSRTGLAYFAAGLCAGFLAFLPLLAFHFLSAPTPSSLPGGKVIWSSAVPGCLSVRHLGIWSALVLACGLGVLYKDQLHTRYRLLACGLVFVATATLCWSGTRAGIYGIAGAALILLVILRRFPPRRCVLLATAAIGLGLLVSTLSLPPDAAFGIFRRDTLPGADLERFSGGRLNLWIGMLKAFAASPLFGVGEGGILWLLPLPGGGHHVQPHNSVIQMLSSWGILASATGAYLIARFLVMAHRAVKHDADVIFIVLLIDCLLIMSLADGVLYFSRFIMWFAGSVAIVLARCERHSVKMSTPRQYPALAPV